MALERNIEARLRWLDEKFRTGGRFTKECLLREVNAADTVNVRISKRTLEYDLERLRGRVSLLDAYVGNEKVYFYENPRASYLTRVLLSIQFCWNVFCHSLPSLTDWKVSMR